MSEENIVKVKGNYGDEVFILDKSTGLVTFTNGIPGSLLTKIWNEALQWYPVKSLSIENLDMPWFNYLILELTTGDVVRLCDRGGPAGNKYMFHGQEYLAIGIYNN